MPAAIFTGLLIGYYLAKSQAQYILMVLLLYRYREKEKFEDLFETCDSEYNFELTKELANSYKTYHEFLLRHQAAKPYAGELFEVYWRSITNMLLKNYSITLALSLIIFRSEFWFFLIPFLAIHVIAMLYIYFRKDNKIDFYAIYFHSLILSSQKINDIFDSNIEG